MMTLHGVDIYLWTPTIPELPKTFGPFTLTFISNRGTRVTTPPSPRVEVLDWPQCRFLSDAEVTDKDVDALMNHLTGLGWRWTMCQKLFRKEGADQFSQPY
ncbi:MAG: isocitrate dehydrogenase [Armatimonadetes bacterium]|nr:isocitrate dehydrogenase [Armatimonadota bacterium]